MSPTRSLMWSAAALVLLGAAIFAYRQANPEPRFNRAHLSEFYRIREVRSAPRPDPAQVRAAITRATGYLRRANHASGQFDYLVNMDPAVTVPRQYNMLRHAGTIYALGMAQELAPERATLEVMRRASAFMISCCMTELDEPGMLGIREPEGFTPRGQAPQYKLGGAGLALVALATLERLSPGSVPLERLRGLGELGRHLQRRDGHFYALYVPSRGGRQGLGRSLFYPGEMALGWLMLYEHDPSAAWIDATVDALLYLAKQRARSGQAPIDHWALLATARLFEIAAGKSLDIPRQALLDHALQICDAILDDAPTRAPLPAMAGALAGNGLVTPTATRLEGTLAALRFLPADHPIVPHLASAAHRGIDFLVRSQVRGGPFDGAFPRAATRIPEDGDERTRRFNESASEVRIDYVQHSVSALVQYLQWLGGTSAGAQRRDFLQPSPAAIAAQHENSM